MAGDRICQALNAIGAIAVMGQSRVYGGGLYTLEPKERGMVGPEGIAPLVAV